LIIFIKTLQCGFFSTGNNQYNWDSKAGSEFSRPMLMPPHYTFNRIRSAFSKICWCLIAIAFLYSPSFADEIEMLHLINAERGKHGLHPLNYDETLSNSAIRHSADMARRGYFGHTCPNGSSPGDRASASGYRWATIGETLFAGSSNAGRAVSSLMRSLSHRNIILNPDFCDVGIGLVVERNSEYQAYWTQVFGRRSGSGRCVATNTNPGNPVSEDDGGGSAGGCFIADLSKPNIPSEVVLAEPLLDLQQISSEAR
jgi:cysteine-rich secretory family protein